MLLKSKGFVMLSYHRQQQEQQQQQQHQQQQQQQQQQHFKPQQQKEPTHKLVKQNQMWIQNLVKFIILLFYLLNKPMGKF